ncbi:hypothetical protein GNI_011080 [Gregarina niphandrodes]|uniref:Uncharacterized protein n=1 Tax=Gregarina niphandrodes TaxID=110365 RepID=A0A023BCR0_GRENI|nr:hypothetical protein GNI_011080 [Gregarina niphandrodes]EZG86041.1 hypothetical protein GNI_011080 [Gregarina niphandrodes]|eukprot:XP_011128796.1 hypothetical protein GNI_011080 [Gregarina niphandrodes]
MSPTRGDIALADEVSMKRDTAADPSGARFQDERHENETTGEPIGLGKSVSVSYLPGLSAEQVTQMRNDTRQEINNVTKTTAEALHRGNTLTEKKSAWPFDIYQATLLFPVDYKYWERDVQTSVGPSKCIAMHAHAYTPDGQQVAADQVFHRHSMKEAHRLAYQAYMKELNKSGF